MARMGAVQLTAARTWLAIGLTVEDALRQSVRSDDLKRRAVAHPRTVRFPRSAEDLPFVWGFGSASPASLQAEESAKRVVNVFLARKPSEIHVRAGKAISQPGKRFGVKGLYFFPQTAAQVLHFLSH